MLSLIVDNLVLLWGLLAFSYGIYNLIRHRGGFNYFLWLFAGTVTVVVIILDHTIFIDLTNAGKEQLVRVLKNITDGIVFVLWLYIVYREGFLRKK
jgi:hypothetical protein